MNVAYRLAGFMLPTTDARMVSQQIMQCDECSALVAQVDTPEHSEHHDATDTRFELIERSFRELEIEHRRLAVAHMELGIKVAHKQDM